MADVCPDCGRPKAENGPDWNVGFQAAHTDEVAPECGRHLPSYWSEEAIPDCLHATVAYQKDSIRALESELNFARTTIADLSYQLGKAQGEAEGHRLVRVGLEVELAEMRKREEWIPVAERFPTMSRHLVAAHAVVLRLQQNPRTQIEQVDAKDIIAEALAATERACCGSIELQSSATQGQIMSKSGPVAGDVVGVAPSLGDSGQLCARRLIPLSAATHWCGMPENHDGECDWLPLPASPRPEPEHRDDGKSG